MFIYKGLFKLWYNKGMFTNQGETFGDLAVLGRDDPASLPDLEQRLIRAIQQNHFSCKIPVNNCGWCQWVASGKIIQLRMRAKPPVFDRPLLPKAAA